MAGVRVVSDETLSKAREMRAQGMFYREIAEALGIGYGTVYYNLSPGAKDRHAEYQDANRTEINESARRYHAENRDRDNAQSKAYHAAHPGAIKAYQDNYRAAHKEELSDYYASYYKAHKGAKAAYNAEWYAINKEKVAAYNRNRRPENAARSAARRALIAGTMIGITIAQKAQVDEIYRKAAEEPNIRCYLCDRIIEMGDRHVDHILPVSKSGPTRPSNLAITCSHCNRSKGAKHPNELGILI